jgi:formylglycine-generating enzyme required for sulfatase activity
VNWHEAAAYCNALSALVKASPCYACQGVGESVTCSVAPELSSGNGIYSCKGYRLPTEAEWEYAYRAGTTGPFYEGAQITSCTADPIANQIGWYKNNTTQMRPPMQKKPNGWKLYDLPGNLWEWCHDWGKADLGVSPATDPVVAAGTIGATANHAIRGGSWAEEAKLMRAAARMFMAPTMRGGTDGFRCVRSP